MRPENLHELAAARARWRAQLLSPGRRLTGVFVTLANPQVVEVLASAGYDFVIIDREFSRMSEQDGLDLIARARALEIPAIVRLPCVDDDEITRALHAGASGIYLSMVRSVAQVRALVASASTPGTIDPPLLVAQLQAGHTDDPLEEILAAGVDVAFVCPPDSTVDVGPGGRRGASGVEEVARAAEEAGVALGAAQGDDPRIRFIAGDSDVGLLAARRASATDGSPRLAPATTDRAGLRVELEALLIEFAYRLDARRGVDVHELFTPEGSFSLDGATVHGRREIERGYIQRASRGPRTSAHLVNNVRVRPLSTGRACVNSLLVLYADDGEPVLDSKAALIVADVEDVCAHQPDGRWLFESRELRTLFRRDAPVVSPVGIS